MAFCSNCGAQISNKTVVCVKCGTAVPQKSIPPVSDDVAALRFLIPIGRSGWAIATGYFGLLSPIPFVGVFAILFGVLAIRDIKKHPDKHGLGRAWFGIIMGAVTLPGYIIVFGCAASA